MTPAFSHSNSNALSYRSFVHDLQFFPTILYSHRTVARAKIFLAVSTTTRSAAEAPTHAVMYHLFQCLAGIFPKARVKEAIDEWVDSVVDEEGLDAELVGHLPHGTETPLKVLDGAAENHDDEVRKEAENVCQGYSKENGSCLPHSDLRLLACMGRQFLRLFFSARRIAAGHCCSS